MNTSLFEIAYEFICPICKNINLGKMTYQATDPANASLNIVNHAPSCDRCSPLSPTMATVRTFVFRAPE